MIKTALLKQYFPVTQGPLKPQLLTFLVLIDIVLFLAGNTKGGRITVPLTSCLTSLESAVRQLTIFVFICKTD
jgi:hypothetical protein